MVSHLAGPLPSLFHLSKIITVKKLASRISEEKKGTTTIAAEHVVVLVTTFCLFDFDRN